MQSQDDSTARKGLPAWFSAVAWSFIGILAAILTICVLSASLLGVLRWTNQATQLTNLTPTGPVARTAGSTPGSASSISTPLPSPSGSGEVSSDQNQGNSSASPTPPTTAEPGGSAATAGPSAGTANAVEPPSLLETTAAQSTQPQMSGPSSGTSQVSSTTSALETASAPSTGAQTPGAAPASTASAQLSPADLTATAVLNSTAAAPELTLTATASSTATPTPTRTATATATATDTPTSTPTPKPEPQVYIVQRDDWLSKLADKFYGDILAYPAIVAATNTKAAQDDSFTVIDDPDIIEVGQKLWIPTPAEVENLLEEEE